MNTEFAWPIGLKIPLFLLSYYYESVILVIHTHKAPQHLSKIVVLQNCFIAASAIFSFVLRFDFFFVVFINAFSRHAASKPLRSPSDCRFLVRTNVSCGRGTGVSVCWDGDRWVDDPVRRQYGRRWRGCRGMRGFPTPEGHQTTGGEGGAGQEQLCKNKRRSLSFGGVNTS